MKLFLALASILMTTSVHAAKYDCSVETSKGTTPLFSIDSDTQDNVSAPLPGTGNAGCVISRSQTPLISCVMDFSPHGSVLAVTELGTAVLSLRAESKGNAISLFCSKK